MPSASSGWAPSTGDGSCRRAAVIFTTRFMVLDLERIRKILESPSKRREISRAVSLQRRTRFHTEPDMDVCGQASAEFLSWVRTFLPKDKFITFRGLFRPPLAGIPLVEDVYRELERVFYSRNASSTYQFTSSELAEDWADYRRERLGEPDVWKTTGWRRMQVSPNSILVVDLPEVQTTGRPEPYFYWLPIEDVVDYETSGGHDGGFEWLVFRQPGNRLAVFDSGSIRVFQLEDNGKLGQLLTDAPHDLGYCPARFFWSTYLDENHPDLKRNPIAKVLSDLDWYLFFSISKRHLDLYAPYPIYSAYESDCNFENNETGDYCDGGFLRNSSGDFKMLADGTVERCPCCSEKRVAGPGSFLEVPIPNVSEGVTDMRNPVQITTVDRDSLEYNVDECDRLEMKIRTSVSGMGGNVSEKEAINETQVAANFESKTSALNALKTNFEQAQKFVEDTICRFRYGSEFLSSSISWGTEFYVFTVAELYDKYGKAKANGASGAELDAIAGQIIEVEHRNNPPVLQRMMILKEIEPLPGRTFDEVMRLYDKGLVDWETTMLKVNFMAYVERFERENINIIEFADRLPMREKVDLITKKLKEYVREQKPPETEPAGGTGSPGQGGGTSGDPGEGQG